MWSAKHLPEWLLSASDHIGEVLSNASWLPETKQHPQKLAHSISEFGLSSADVERFKRCTSEGFAQHEFLWPRTIAAITGVQHLLSALPKAIRAARRHLECVLLYVSPPVL